MSRYIPEAIRQMVAERANNTGEYCLLPQHMAGFPFEIDHITSLKHGGGSSLDNLALSCPICNGNKGSDLGTFVEGQLVRFFNPRTDNWREHFELFYGKILPKTPIGEATARIFDFNRPEDIAVRQKLQGL
ncbi:MAG: HNH endonuclease [Saprospiraceae bacterium]|nr:HNH endonuclease [Saprospiraceae bacterium]